MSHRCDPLRSPSPPRSSLALGAAIRVAAGGPATRRGHIAGSTTRRPPARSESSAFPLLQHGVTPVDDGEVLITGVPPGSGGPVTAEGTPLGDGAWSATIAFPSPGEWQIRVTHSELAHAGADGGHCRRAGLALPSVAAADCRVGRSGPRAAARAA